MERTLPQPAHTELYEEELYTEAQVDEQIDLIADIMVKNYRGRNPLFVCLLRGGAPFATDLMKKIAAKDPHFHPELDYMLVRTYGDKQVAHDPELIMGLAPSTEVMGRLVVFLDEVLETGSTAAFTTDLVRGWGAANVDLCVLVNKTGEKTPKFSGIKNVLYGFEADPNKWLVGKGMDDVRIGKEAGRWWGNIAVALSDEAIKQLVSTEQL